MKVKEGERRKKCNDLFSLEGCTKKISVDASFKMTRERRSAPCLVRGRKEKIMWGEEGRGRVLKLWGGVGKVRPCDKGKRDGKKRKGKREGRRKGRMKGGSKEGDIKDGIKGNKE